ncbi:MAG: hypothetical protein ACM3PS_07595 [Syntrophothermus sp.]|jgi:hypothetical protein
MSLAKAIMSGLVGACTLTLIHETARRLSPDAPRMDVLGMRAISKSMRAMGHQPPDNSSLHRAALVGDVLANALYYSLVGGGSQKGVWLRGAGLGVAAGIGGVVLPEPMGLGGEPSGRSTATKAMTVGWYLAGALAAAATYRLLTTRQSYGNL